eukprot:10919855-Ditylum_brightwellii.AAC.1
MVCDVAFMEVCTTNSKDSQLGFCLHILISILLEERFNELHESLLSKVKEILATVLDEKNIDTTIHEISPVLNKLIISLLQ